MNYKKIYNSIIEKRKTEIPIGYSEKHHIIPRSLGGDNSKNNLVRLTAREHFICHYLLVMIYEKETFEWYKMMNAFLMMKCSTIKQERYFNSRIYEFLKINFSKLTSNNQIGEKNSNFGTMWISNIELKMSKKISNIELIPEGWVKGRNKWNIGRKKKICKKCGSLVCDRPDVCVGGYRIRGFIEFLGFDETVLGSNLFYKEYDRIILLLITEYHINKLSIENIRKKYNFPSNERVRMMFKSLGIERRSLSESMLNFYNPQIAQLAER